MTRFNIRQLGSLIRERRGDEGIRQIAKKIGISSATLSRVERGNLPDLETFAKLCKWLHVDPAEMLGVDAPKLTSPEPTVTAHFRADQAMNPQLAAALAELILAGHRKLQTLATEAE